MQAFHTLLNLNGLAKLVTLHQICYPQTIGETWLHQLSLYVAHFFPLKVKIKENIVLIINLSFY